MINRILYAADLGLYGPYLMDQVASLAQSTGAKVDVLHVVEPMGVFAESIINTFMPEEEKKYLRAKGLSEVLETIRLQVIDTLNSDYAESIQKVTLDQVIVEIGHPAKVIVEQARLRGSDLIAIGACGQNASSDLHMGSVATQVLQQSYVPAFVIPMTPLNELKRR